MEILKLRGEEKLSKYFDVEEENGIEVYISKGERYNGIVEIYDMEEKLKVRGELKDGKQEGKWIYYYESGEIKVEENYKGGLLEGEYNQYSKNGKKETEGKYHLNRKVGIWVEWGEEDGEKLVTKVPYENGMVNGTSNIYSEDGKLLYSGEYKNDKMLNVTIWKQDGDKRVVIKKEAENIKIYEEYKKGRVWSVKRYKDDKLEGWQESYEDAFGKIHDIPLKREYYKNGELRESERYTSKGELYYKIEVSEDGEATVQRLR